MTRIFSGLVALARIMPPFSYPMNRPKEDAPGTSDIIPAASAGRREEPNMAPDALRFVR
jgi:hypothetical protein